MTIRATHLRLLPPPPLTNMGLDHPVFGAAAIGDLTRRLRLAEESGDVAAASNVRAGFRAAAAAMREAATRPLDLDPYRTATPATRPLPLLIVMEPDSAVYRWLVESEGLSRSRVKRCSSWAGALDAEFKAQREGRPTMTIGKAS